MSSGITVALVYGFKASAIAQEMYENDTLFDNGVSRVAATMVAQEASEDTFGEVRAELLALVEGGLQG